ncbi:hypothetical protein C6P45_002753 [Maudiozyma exigua]|uniref:Uncharacterized protein n=1 Tax=Maudiozyma exigua TaxID=34358 RepID=A0A9P6VWN7_MAUEX|nr:hypothetical protein C6P45_002753 [Kazachstania exigua]
MTENSSALWEEKSDNIPVKSFTGYTVKFGGWQREKPVQSTTVPEKTDTNDETVTTSDAVTSTETTATEQDDVKQE